FVKSALIPQQDTRTSSIQTTDRRPTSPEAKNKIKRRLIKQIKRKKGDMTTSLSYIQRTSGTPKPTANFNRSITLRTIWVENSLRHVLCIRQGVDFVPGVKMMWTNEHSRQKNKQNYNMRQGGTKTQTRPLLSLPSPDDP
ncbi:unnamed protein product, partial [Ectocarpus fasciculatus]